MPAAARVHRRRSSRRRTSFRRCARVEDDTRDTLVWRILAKICCREVCCETLSRERQRRSQAKEPRTGSRTPIAISPSPTASWGASMPASRRGKCCRRRYIARLPRCSSFAAPPTVLPSQNARERRGCGGVFASGTEAAGCPRAPPECCSAEKAAA